jgi:chorismate mutase/prephenate dehydratase
MENKLKSLRAKVDRLDEKILSLLLKRIDLVKKIGLVKTTNGIPVFDPAREGEILFRLKKLSMGKIPEDKLELLFKEIFSLSRSYEKKLKIAYLGPMGSFSELATIGYFGNSCDFISTKKIQDVFELTDRRECDFGVVPVENSLEGAIGLTLDLLIDSNVKICGEIYKEITHNLLSLNDNIKNLKRLYTHPQALAQCRTFIDKNLPEIEIIEVDSTSESARFASKDVESGAIASDRAAELYGLRILKSRIEDNTNNYTRFIVLGKTDNSPTGNDKTSIIISVKDEAGALHRALNSFAQYGINLSKIESRPMKKRPWEYIFFIDFDGHLNNKIVKRALSELSKECLFLKILGSYPKVR